MRLVIFSILFLAFLATTVQAAGCPVVYARTTGDLLNEVPNIDAQLQGCPLRFPSGLSWLVSNGNLVVEIAMDDGSTEHVTAEVQNKQVTGVSRGQSACKNKILVRERDLDLALGSRNRAGAFAYLYGQKALRVKGCTWWTSFKGFFVNPVGRMVARRNAPSSVPAPVSQGKPDNCDDTWLPGHRGYAENKQLWDSYSADTDGVCQSQYGRGVPGPCAHSVQLSVQGNPYYLCWYNV